mmetsp:Transcript_18874/g.43889  ORF Transcript_18874/g.43889 Transcript_18874/m.43889 type:complete len:191 (+) Transcript_18874:1089-1661(+)
MRLLVIRDTKTAFAISRATIWFIPQHCNAVSPLGPSLLAPTKRVQQVSNRTTSSLLVGVLSLGGALVLRDINATARLAVLGNVLGGSGSCLPPVLGDNRLYLCNLGAPLLAQHKSPSTQYPTRLNLITILGDWEGLSLATVSSVRKRKPESTMQQDCMPWAPITGMGLLCNTAVENLGKTRGRGGRYPGG